MPFSNCLCHILFRRYLPLSLKVVEKWSKCKSILAPNVRDKKSALANSEYYAIVWYTF